MHYNTVCIIQVYAQREGPDEKAEQAPNEQIEKEKPGEKKVAEKPPRKMRRVQKFPPLTAQIKRKTFKKESGLQIHIYILPRAC